MDFTKLNELTQNINLEETNQNSGTGFEELPDGYYLGELEKIELKETKTNQDPMFSCQFKVVENGYKLDDEKLKFVPIASTSNRKIFINYIIKYEKDEKGNITGIDEKAYKRFVSDMLKFVGENNESLLDKAFFSQGTSVLEQAFELIIGARLYIHLDTPSNGNNQWKNPISWKRASDIGLPL